MVPVRSSAHTAIQVPASRGAEPWVASHAHQHAVVACSRRAATCIDSSAIHRAKPPVTAAARAHGMKLADASWPPPFRLALASALTSRRLVARRLAALGTGSRSRLARPAQRRRHPSRNTPSPDAKPPRIERRAHRATTGATPRSHVYDLNKDRIYEGKLPPMLYAIGTLQVNVDANGKVRRLHWMRAPKHAPEVIAEIERTVLAAAPFPAASAARQGDLDRHLAVGQERPFPARHAHRRAAA